MSLDFGSRAALATSSNFVTEFLMCLGFGDAEDTTGGGSHQEGGFVLLPFDFSSRALRRLCNRLVGFGDAEDTSGGISHQEGGFILLGDSKDTTGGGSHHQEGGFTMIFINFSTHHRHGREGIGRSDHATTSVCMSMRRLMMTVDT